MDDTTGGRLGEVRKALDTVIDPELGLPVTDLGLVYGIDVADGTVTVHMTTTTPICPLASHLLQVADARLRELPWVEEVLVRSVSEPPWSPERMSDRARAILGMG